MMIIINIKIKLEEFINALLLEARAMLFLSIFVNEEEDWEAANYNRIPGLVHYHKQVFFLQLFRFWYR